MVPGRKTNGVSAPKFHTTFQVAGYFGVSLPTVINWINQGMMQAHRTPGGHRRISPDEVVNFARKYNYPLSSEFLSSASVKEYRVLIAFEDNDLSEMVHEYLKLKGFEVEEAGSSFQIGFKLAKFQPHLCVLDMAMSDLNGFDAVRFIREQNDIRNMALLGCVQIGGSKQDVSEFDGIIRKPLNLDDLHMRVCELLFLPVG